MNFEFSCQDCESIFELTIEDNQQLENVFCPECKSTEFDCIGYDIFSSAKLSELSKKIVELEYRIRKLEDPDAIAMEIN